MLPRVVALSAGGPASAAAVVAEVSLPAANFCRLLAGRLDPAASGVRVSGNPSAAAAFLAVAATMGCD